MKSIQHANKKMNLGFHHLYHSIKTNNQIQIKASKQRNKKLLTSVFHIPTCSGMPIAFRVLTHSRISRCSCNFILLFPLSPECGNTLFIPHLSYYVMLCPLYHLLPICELQTPNCFLACHGALISYTLLLHPVS